MEDICDIFVFSRAGVTLELGVCENRGFFSLTISKP